MNVLPNVLAAIGHTPLVRVNHLNLGASAEVLVKLEARNPGGSAKDRPALAMVEAAEKAGLLRPGGTIIEPTSGNTGIGLALVAAVRGYRMVLVMPDTMSVERRRLAAAYGAEVVLTPGAEGMKGSIAKAEALHAATPNSIIPQQFANPANPAAHAASTGPEILADLDGRVDVFVAGVGTGGTVTGAGRALKAACPACEVVAVEPAGSKVLEGEAAGPHRIQGIGANFVPANFDRAIVDRVMAVTDDAAAETARAAARREGLLIGFSGGAALAAALELARDPAYAGKRIVALLPDSGERYLSGDLFA